MLTLFPPTAPYAEHEIILTNHQSLYVEECGNPTGTPILVMQGGPGQSVQPSHRQLFNPEQYRMILFDQRGVGRSKPNGTLEENTLLSILDDMDYIREHLAIHRMYIAGGGFGSLLALAYSSKHNEIVTGLVLWSICLGQNNDIDWKLQEKNTDNSVSSKISAHYYDNHLFAQEYNVLKNLDSLKDTPVFILKMQNDTSYLCENAKKLQKSLPKAKLQIVSTPGEFKNHLELIYS